MPLGTKNSAEERRKELGTLAKEIADLKVDTTSIPTRDRVAERLRKLSEEKPPTPSEQATVVRQE